jgi:hypothetical protein
MTSADKVGGSKKGQNHADVILEWSLKGISSLTHTNLCVPQNRKKDRQFLDS